MKTYNPQDKELTVVFNHDENLDSCEELFERELANGKKVIGFEKSGKYYVKGHLAKAWGWNKFYSCAPASKDGYGTVKNTGWNYYENITLWEKEVD